MLHEQMQQPHSDRLQLRETRLDVRGYEVRAPRRGREGECFLDPHRRWRVGWEVEWGGWRRGCGGEEGPEGEFEEGDEESRVEGGDEDCEEEEGCGC